jgi:cellulose synthase/poly-beta-1,6-N-acetylglucosamine synthase-like glycosyltransferase
MQSLGSLLLLTLVLLAAFPVLVLCVEIIAAVFFAKQAYLENSSLPRPRIGVLIPAHNEGIGLKPTLENVKSQLRETDRLLVVADNCTDDTAAIATSLGVQIIERKDPVHVGKGYALDWGIRHFALDPPAVLIIVDADCTFGEGSIEKLASACYAEDRPVQALNLMKAPKEFPGTFQLAEFAWRVKNWIRPLGLRALNLSCQLTGTGMAFPWEIIRSARLATGEIVEDLKLGMDLARAGKPALFLASASVVSYFPLSQAGIDSQRKRWQQGHLNMIGRLAPRMIRDAIINRDVHLLMLALDLTVPPLIFLALIEAGLLAVSIMALWFGAATLSFYMALTINVLFAVAVLVCWAEFGRDIMPAKTFLMIPLLIGKRLLLYREILFGRRAPQHWVRTDRSRPKPPSP